MKTSDFQTLEPVLRDPLWQNGEYIIFSRFSLITGVNLGAQQQHDKIMVNDSDSVRTICCAATYRSKSVEYTSEV
jgi:hypothetical protein